MSAAYSQVKVGDLLECIVSFPPHIQEGDVLEVMEVDVKTKFGQECITLNTCRCETGVNHDKVEKGYLWSWPSNGIHFKLKEQPMTQEEVDRAVPLPDPELAWNVFRRKPCP